MLKFLPSLPSLPSSTLPTGKSAYIEHVTYDDEITMVIFFIAIAVVCQACGQNYM